MINYILFRQYWFDKICLHYLPRSEPAIATRTKLSDMASGPIQKIML